MTKSTCALWTLGLAALLPHAAQAQMTITESATVNLAIPDGNLSGLASSLSITTPMTQITDVTVTLTISGTGYGAVNGDFYAYLSYGGEKAVLLNRVGRSSGSSIGYDDSGFSSVTFDDAAANGDIHQYQLTLSGSAVTGAWAPDARATDPLSALDTDSRTAFLSVFDGLNPNGEWTLFVADLQSGGTAQIDSWSLQVTAVPEPATYGIVTGVGLLGFLYWRRKK